MLIIIDVRTQSNSIACSARGSSEEVERASALDYKNGFLATIKLMKVIVLNALGVIFVRIATGNVISVNLFPGIHS
jgi:hypothetical protein